MTPKRKTPQLFYYKGKSQTLREWAKETGISVGALELRIKRRGWTVEKALTTPMQRHAGRSKYA